MSDFVQRFHFLDSPVRGEIAQLGESVAAVLDRNDYPARVQELLAELMTASVLLACTLKFEGSLILQARGDGPLETLMAECTHDGDVRGIAQVGVWLPAHDHATLAEIFNNGQLCITIDPTNGQRYQGIVPFDGNNLSACLEHYFMQSEQLPTRIWLSAEQGQAGGLLLQVTPGAIARDGDESTVEDADIWPRLQQITETVTPQELIELPSMELLYRLYHEENVEVLEAQDVKFNCSCSRERTEAALVSLGSEELRDIIEEQGKIQIVCQFCNEEYVFDAIDVEQMILGGSGQPNVIH